MSSQAEPSDALHPDVSAISDWSYVGCGSRGSRPLLVGLLVALWTLTALGGWAPTARAQAPIVVYDERFENGVGATPVTLTDYVGAAGQRYSAAPGWLTACNGRVLQFNSPNAALAASGCVSLFNYGRARQLAYALGVQGGVTPTTNHAVSAYTENNPGANSVEFETVGELPLPTNGRFLTFQVDAAAVNCGVSAPLYQFFLTSGATSTPVGGLINACTSTRSVNVPGIAGAAGPTAARIGTYTSNGSVLFTGASLGIRLLNGNGSGNGNDAAFDNIRILDSTPLLGKSFSPATLNAGGTSTLTFTITNTTERAAKNGWSLTDTLPASLIVASPANASTTCSAGQVAAVAGGDSVTVSGNLSAGQASCTASVDVTASTPGTYANGPANVTTTGLEPPPPSFLQFLGADLAIVKTASPGSITPGTNVTFTLAVTNLGPDTAVNARVSDPLPAGLAFVSASPGCSAAGMDVTCTVGSLPAGASQTFTVTASVAGSVTDRVTNTATVTSDTPDPNQGNNNSTAVVPLQPLASVRGEADLAIRKVASVSEVGPGGQVLYTLVVENHGPGDATGVTVNDAPPAGIVLQSASASQGSCTVAPAGLACSLGGLLAGGSAQILLTAQATAGAAGSLTNTASVTGAQPDPDPASNTDAETVSVPDPPPRSQPRADLTIAKQGDRTGAIGRPLEYTIVVRNGGPAAATGVSVIDTPSAPARLVSVETTAGSCRRSLPMTCSLGTVDPGETVTITVVVEPSESGTLRNAASATGDGLDPKTADNLAVVSTRVKPALTLTKVAGRKRVRAGRTVTFAIRVRNPTDVTVRNVRTCDALPPGLAYVSSRARAKLSEGRHCWTAKRLGAGQSQTYRLTARAVPGASGRLVNRVTTTSPETATVRDRSTVRVQAQRAPSGGVTG